LNWRNHESWDLEYFLEDSKLVDVEGFVQHAADVYRTMKPFNDYLNTALADFIMPSR